MRQEEWLALESIYKSGAARSIGLSHYCSQHIDDVLEVATVAPTVNQVEYHGTPTPGRPYVAAPWLSALERR